jgi:hypothetical protein
MQHWRPRDNRKSVRISVRVRTNDGWIDAVVRNVSDRGMMLHSLEPLRRNQFVEITRGRHRLVGRIVWNSETASGLHAREPVDLKGLLGEPEASPAPDGLDRRARPRSETTQRVVPTAEQAEASRFMGRAFEFVFLLAAVSCVAGLAAVSIGEAFAKPLEHVQGALATQP